MTQRTRKTPKNPTCYAGPWPAKLVEAISFHEAGHALMALHHGIRIKQVWAADGRSCSEHGENATIHGMTEFKKDVPISLFVSAMLNVAPESAEKFAPHYDEFKNIHKENPEFYDTLADDAEGKPFVGDYFNGTHNDLSLAFGTVAPFYQLMGMSYEEGLAAFDQEFRIPAENVMRSYRKQITALAEKLIEKRSLEGDEVHNIVCGSGGPAVPGCSAKLPDPVSSRLKGRGFFPGIMIIEVRRGHH